MGTHWEALFHGKSTGNSLGSTFSRKKYRELTENKKPLSSPRGSSDCGLLKTEKKRHLYGYLFSFFMAKTEIFL